MEEIDRVLAVPDVTTVIGARDKALIQLMYNSGGRVQELADLSVSDLHLENPPSVRLTGKGRKVRIIQLWQETVEVVRHYIRIREENRISSEHLFLNIKHKPMTRFGIGRRLGRLAEAASKKCPSLCNRRITPHVIRHTTALLLIGAGNDITIVKDWLGHADTIVQYDFDGTSDAERREDKKGSNDLVEKGSPIYDLSGADSTSQAVSVGFQGGSTGPGFFTTSALDDPAKPSLSFEAIISPELSGTTTGYMIATYDGSRRGYFIMGTDGNLYAAAGNSWANRSIYVEPYDTSAWYYVAATMTYDGSSQTTIHTYRANLSAGETNLTHNTFVANGDFHNGLAYGIGVLNYNGAIYQPFNAVIDEVTFYDGLKDEAFFQANLDRVIAPIPSGTIIFFN